MQIKMGSSE